MSNAEEQVLSLQKNFTLPEIASRLCGDSCRFSVTCVLQIMNNYTLSKTGNPDETPVYFSMPSNDGVNDTGQNTW